MCSGSRLKGGMTKFKAVMTKPKAVMTKPKAVMTKPKVGMTKPKVGMTKSKAGMTKFEAGTKAHLATVGLANSVRVPPILNPESAQALAASRSHSLWLTKTPPPPPFAPFHTLSNVTFNMSYAMSAPSCNWSKRKTRRSSSSKTPVPASKSGVGVA
jgi:hypothetical protein